MRALKTLFPLSFDFIAVYVSPTATIPELLFRFQRKYHAHGLGSHLVPIRYIKCPNFYSEAALVDLKSIYPLTNDELGRTISRGAPIWVYGDRSRGQYQLERPVTPHSIDRAFGRVRGVSIGPPAAVGQQPQWIFRGKRQRTPASRTTLTKAE